MGTYLREQAHRKRIFLLQEIEAFRSEFSVLLGETLKGKGGRPSFDPVLMFKVCMRKFLYHLSDENTEWYIRDRVSFRNFLGLTLSDRASGCQDDLALW
jgi:hypothetical protein